MWTRPLRRSLTGWLAPRWPNFSLKVRAPSARPRIWCPRQIPKIGTRPPRPRTAAPAVPVVRARAGHLPHEVHAREVGRGLRLPDEGALVQVERREASPQDSA